MEDIEFVEVTIGNKTWLTTAKDLALREDLAAIFPGVSLATTLVRAPADTATLHFPGDDEVVSLATPFREWIVGYNAKHDVLAYKTS